jgi:hypothetical protein
LSLWAPALRLFGTNRLLALTAPAALFTLTRRRGLSTAPGMPTAHAAVRTPACWSICMRACGGVSRYSVTFHDNIN